MKKSTLWMMAAVAVLALSGCAQPSKRSGTETLDRITAEIDQGARDRKAATPKAVEQALLPTGAREAPAPAREPRFDLIVNGAPAQQVFSAIVTGTRYSMLLPPELSGAITVSLKDVTVREALDALRDLYGYEYRIQGNRIHVQPNTLQSRIFQINYLAGRRQGVTDISVSSGSISRAVTPGGQGGAAASPAWQRPPPTRWRRCSSRASAAVPVSMTAKTARSTACASAFRDCP